jgi:hypothetical protein
MRTAASTLLELDELGVTFKPGQTALGHHWILSDGEDHDVGRTKLFYEGAGKTVGRLMRVTGLSTTGEIHATVNAPDGTELYRLHSTPGKNKHVDISDAGGTLIGQARRNDLSLELFGPDGEITLARIARTSKEDMAFPIETPDGERLGVLTKQKLEVYSPSISQMVFAPQLSSNSIAFQATMHLGFAGSREYHLRVESRPHSEPLATLLALSPVIAAYAY